MLRVAAHNQAETNGRNFAGDSFKLIFLNENVSIWMKISLKFVPKGPVNNIPALVRRLGDKPLSEAMTVRSLTHMCVNRLTSKSLWNLIIVASLPLGHLGFMAGSESYISRTFCLYK